MTPIPLPLTRDLVLIGGGHAHALVLKQWGMRPLPGARLTLINPGPTAPYTGMLPGFVAGHYDRNSLEIDLVRLARFAGARLILGTATGLDPETRRVTIEGRGEIAYDVASIDIGITSAMPDLPGFPEYGVPAKPLARFADIWASFRDGKAPGPVAVIGAGVAGVELALAMHYALSTRGASTPQIALIDAGTALTSVPARVRNRLRTILDQRGIMLHEGSPPVEVSADAVRLASGDLIPAALTVGAAGARPWDWLSETGLDLKNGFLTVDETLRTSNPNVFAAGDCAHMPHAPRPKAGVYAVRAAPVLAHNLRAALAGGTARPFRPQSDYLKLISLGGKDAIGEKWGLVRQGSGVWAWKNRIDRAFMEKLSDLRPMTLPPRPAEAALGLAQALGTEPPCGGCGAKVGPGTLAATLARNPGASRQDVRTLPGDDAAVISLGGKRQVISTDHLRAVTEDPHIMARIAALHALGDIWAMGATPQAALATVILPRLSEDLQSRWLDEIMDAATQTFAEAGASLAGGHTTVGSELTLGFTLTGLLDGNPIALSGAQPGDALILTRAIGSGTLFAGEMRLKASGEDVAALLAELTRSQGPAAALLTGAHAMTDVTGFGLAGHLLNIADRSGVGVELDLDTVPLLDGARELALRGVRSTLYPQNRSHVAPRLDGFDEDDPRAALLLDPQTAGGFLAAVPPDQSGDLLEALAAAAFPSARIGTITDGPPRILIR